MRKLALILILILILAAATAAMFFLNTGQCSYSNPAKGYLKKQPCVINFLCAEGKKAFSDACGCGCEVIN